MIERLFHRILLRRHFWRHATFSEVAELYASRVLRMTALHLVGGFISIFLYRNGFTVFEIALCWVGFYSLKTVFALPAARFISIIGPKRAMFVANILYIPAMVGFAMLPSLGPWVLIPVFIVEALSTVMYTIAHNVDFSKVKSLRHAGKELAVMNIVEKLASGLSPVIGGFLALAFGAEVVLVLSAVLFLVAALPLFKTGEKVRLGKPLHLRALPWNLIRKHAATHATLGFEYFSSNTAWSLFVAIFIIGFANGDEVYAVFGVLSSVILFMSLVASYAYGKLIDNKHGKDLMRLSTIAHSVTHLFRGFITTPVSVATLNVANEAAVTGIHMPYTRALFDNADRSGNRIAYLGIMEVLLGLGGVAAAGLLALCVYVFADENGFKVVFLIAALVALIPLTARFPLYRK